MNNSDKKITELPIATELQQDDVLAIVQNGLTSQVSLATLREQMQMQLSIPQARIKVARDNTGAHDGHDRVFASWEGSDTNFLKFNPEFWLYRYRKADFAKRKNPIKKKIVEGEEGIEKEQQYIARKKRFVHPSHMHGIDEDGEKSATHLYKGEQIVVIDGEKHLLPARATEWPVEKVPYRETLLSIEPWKYFKLQGQSGQETLHPKEFPLERQPVPKGAHSGNARMVVFKVRIAIDNPAKDPMQPKLFGPFSETFIFFPHRVKGYFVNLKCYLGEEAAPSLRRRMKSFTKV
jgi:hypothetical protein